MSRIFVTGSAGFIGFHLCRLLLAEGHHVTGYDGMTSYYDPALKRARHGLLAAHPNFTRIEALLEDDLRLHTAVAESGADRIIHLAAQAGVRYSIENPRAYVDANLIGTFNVLEAARRFAPSHFMLASTSSVYGANTKMPFREDDAADSPLTLYAATKKATEAMAHSYASLWSVPTTAFRFFSVYGSWGRPDMALFKFTEAILAGRPIDLYNHGDMRRDFTHVGDLVRAIAMLAEVPPEAGIPFRTVNIGKAAPVALLDFVAELEKVLGRPALRNLLPMQPGDVPATFADVTRLKELTGFVPSTGIAEGIREFADWYLAHYRPSAERTGT
jgi:UDP-glucuronate 4-epimerase